nr:hypothetical protein [Burkholderia sp. PAMC 28687]
MASPFIMPDEFVQGFFKSGQTLLQAYTGVADASALQDAPASAPNLPGLALAQAQAHYWQQQMALIHGHARERYR